MVMAAARKVAAAGCTLSLHSRRTFYANPLSYCLTKRNAEQWYAGMTFDHTGDTSLPRRLAAERPRIDTDNAAGSAAFIVF